MSLFCGSCFGRGLVPSDAADLSRQEVIDLFNLSTQLNGSRLIVHGLFARADTKNTNGRIYPKGILKREVKRFKVQHIRTGTALGELNHPSYYSCYFRSLNLPNISHQVLDVHWRGNELWGTIEVLPTPAGLLLWELYSRGIKLGVSSRGWASVVADPVNNRVMVDDDFQLITFDFVTEPSNAGAYLVPIHTKYRKALPDQLRAVRASYLGFGSSDMASLGQLPAASVLSKWLKATKKAMAAVQYSSCGGQEPTYALAARTLQQPTAAAIACGSEDAANSSCMYSNAAVGSMLQALNTRSGSCMLPSTTHLGGGVILGSHYKVLHEPWMPVDPAGREFKVHLSLVATKAHIMQQKQQQRMEGAVPAAAAAAIQQQQPPQSVQQEQKQQQQAVSSADKAYTTHSIACKTMPLQPLLQQHLQQQQQSVKGPTVPQEACSSSNQPVQNRKQQQQQQQQPESWQDAQQQQQQHTQQQQQHTQQLNTWSTGRDGQLHTGSTTYSILSHGSLSSQHLAAAHDMLLCSATTDMSGCSLGPAVPPQPVAAGAGGTTGSTLSHQAGGTLISQPPRQRVKPRRHQSAPGSSLKPRTWDWERPQAVITAAKPSALQTVHYSCNWDRPHAAAKANALRTVAAAPMEAVVGCSAPACAMPTVADAAEATSIAVNEPLVEVLRSAQSPSGAVQPQEATVAVGAADEAELLHQVALQHSSEPGLLQSRMAAVAWQHMPNSQQPLQKEQQQQHKQANQQQQQQQQADQQQQQQQADQQQQQQQQQADQQQQQQQAEEHKCQEQQCHQPLQQKQPNASGLDADYGEIRDTLQAYQSEYRRQKYHLRSEAMQAAGV